ncbi:MAG: hypothetical protein GEV06_23330 [Luteitalea sp.]|nr:hypothetical protein [Luteitalea sp.]
MLYANYLLVQREHEDHAALGAAFQRYVAALDAAKDRMPPNLYDFMTASWHYDHLDRRALHDMRLRTFTVTETQVANTQNWEISIEIVLLGAYFDRELHLRYGNVKKYSTGIPETARRTPSGSHGDLLTDEVAVLKEGECVHAMEFSSGSIFEISFCGSFDYKFGETQVP